MREHEPGDVARDHERKLDVPEGLGADEEAGAVLAGAEQVPAAAERVGGQREDRLAGEEEQADVVRGRVRERDRHQRRREAGGQVGHAARAVDGVHAVDREPVEGGDQRHDREQPRAVDQLDGEAGADPGVGDRGDERLGLPQPGRSRAEAVERDGADHDQHHGLGARQRGEPGEPAQEPPPPEHAVAQLEHGEAREQVEVDGERLGVARPGVDAVERHPEPRDRGVDERRGRDRGRPVAVRRDQLQPGERDQAGRRGPAAEPARVRERLGVRPAQEPAARAPDRAPRVERREHVPEQDGDRDEPEPEDHVDERRRDVLRRHLGAGEAGADDQDQQGDADGPADDVRRRAGQDAAERRRQRPERVALQPRGRPEHAQRRERDHQHGPGGPAEQPGRDRQVGAAGEAVRRGGGREQQGDDRSGACRAGERARRCGRHRLRV
ncbi:MAG TPA: hypothetical protein VNS09_06055 [Solirubrobacter sp.]|nr:hypothetical protein [Solirubrobacter sp.]